MEKLFLGHRNRCMGSCLQKEMLVLLILESAFMETVSYASYSIDVHHKY